MSLLGRVDDDVFGDWCSCSVSCIRADGHVTSWLSCFLLPNAYNIYRAGEDELVVWVPRAQLPDCTAKEPLASADNDGDVAEESLGSPSAAHGVCSGVAGGRGLAASSDGGCALASPVSSVASAVAEVPTGSASNSAPSSPLSLTPPLMLAHEQVQGKQRRERVEGGRRKDQHGEMAGKSKKEKKAEEGEEKEEQDEEEEDEEEKNGKNEGGQQGASVERKSGHSKVGRKESERHKLGKGKRRTVDMRAKGSAGDGQVREEEGEGGLSEDKEEYEGEEELASEASKQPSKKAKGDKGGEEGKREKGGKLGVRHSGKGAARQGRSVLMAC